jgi:hypothetical protein
MSRQKISLNNLSGPDSRDLSGRYPADRIRVSAWYCQNLSEVPACYLGITRGWVRPFYLPVLPLYGFTKLYTNPFLLIYYLPSFKLPVLVLVWGIERKKLNSGSHSDCMGLVVATLGAEGNLSNANHRKEECWGSGNLLRSSGMR